MKFRAVLPERPVVKAEDAVTQGESLSGDFDKEDRCTETMGVVVSYYCDVVDGEKGCCPNGETCTSGGGGNGGCVNTGYVPCPGDDFCCRMCSHPPPLALSTHNHDFILTRLADGYTCYRDSSNNPQCSLYTTYTTTPPPTIHTTTSTSPRPTSTPEGNDGDNGDDDLPDSPDSNSNNSNSTSSSSRPTSSGFPSVSSQFSGVSDPKGHWSFFALAPLLVLAGKYIE